MSSYMAISNGRSFVLVEATPEARALTGRDVELQCAEDGRLVLRDETARAVLARVAPTGCAVLLRGEPGTGKERLAHAIHAAAAGAKVPSSRSTSRVCVPPELTPSSLATPGGRSREKSQIALGCSHLSQAYWGNGGGTCTSNPRGQMVLQYLNYN
jgi:hypothetical protein